MVTIETVESGENATVYKASDVKHKYRIATKVPILVFLLFQQPWT